MSAFDTDLFLALNAGANPNPYIALFAIAVTRFAILLVPCYIAVLWLQGSRRRRLLAFALVLALAIAIGLSFLTGLVIFRPRPFMVERGHTDGVSTDEYVAHEYAKVFYHYSHRLKLADRCELEVFDGPHTINGKGTFEFLKKNLK